VRKKTEKNAGKKNATTAGQTCNKTDRQTDRQTDKQGITSELIVQGETKK